MAERSNNTLSSAPYKPWTIALLLIVVGAGTTKTSSSNNGGRAIPGSLSLFGL